jgi:hypothetical protein
LVDAGEMMMDASVPDAGAQDMPVECNKQEDHPNGITIIHWAEFPVTPGQTEVTVCRPWLRTTPPFNRDFCYRKVADWYHGTSTGFVECGGENTVTPSWAGKPLSITVHN